jgi:multiple sugar transport system ATP-binding protein
VVLGDGGPEDLVLPVGGAAEVDDGRIRFEDGAVLPLPRQFRDALSAGQKIVFGLRPDDVYPSGHGLHSGEEHEVHKTEMLVTVTEPLGNETLVFAEFKGRDWVSRMLNPRPLRAGDRVEMSLDLSQAHLFSADTGKSLRS